MPSNVSVIALSLGVLELISLKGIIVRDEQARTELRSKLGDDFGLILTIYESKGQRI